MGVALVPVGCAGKRSEKLLQSFKSCKGFRGFKRFTGFKVLRV